MPEFGPRQPMDEEKNKKEGDEMSRRDFLKKIGVAAGMLAAGATALELTG